MGQHQRGNRNAQQGRNRGSQHGDNRSPTRVEPLNDEVITEGGKILVEKAEQLGKQLVQERLTTSQIRNIYGAVKKMQMKGELDTHKLLMLKPKLAYAAKRHGKEIKGVDTLKTVLTQAIDLVGKEQIESNRQGNFNRFVDFFEAILAYHKDAGGRDS